MLDWQTTPYSMRCAAGSSSTSTFVPPRESSPAVQRIGLYPESGAAMIAGASRALRNGGAREGARVSSNRAHVAPGEEPSQGVYSDTVSVGSRSEPRWWSRATARIWWDWLEWMRRRGVKYPISRGKLSICDAWSNANDQMRLFMPSTRSRSPRIFRIT